MVFFFFFQAEDGIRDAQESRGLGDVYKRQVQDKLTRAEYISVREWEQDVRLVCANAKIFNLQNSVYYKMAEQLEAFLDKRLPKLNKELQLWSSLTDASAHPEWRNRCSELLVELKKQPEAGFFLMPVDWRALNLPDYPIIIKQPMDLFTAEQKLRDSYTCPNDFVSDIRLIWKNALTYNQPESAAAKMAKKMKDGFRSKFLKLFQPLDEEDIRAGKRRRLSTTDKIMVTPLEKSSKVQDFEFVNLRTNLGKLTAEELQRSVIVAQERNVSCVESTMDAVSLNLDLLTPGDFRYLAKYVAMFRDS
eukprot:TRINITY_DN20785_c0_g1_i4.p1 TRINITY_DN20785_c0_g1~~TRINITY_DN20785_c0_g1_i4.p1  ORF type:complete len:305 (+),score=94.65 TRINITY_DN20785_c0_g1_i4:31-945(+)